MIVSLRQYSSHHKGSDEPEGFLYFRSVKTMEYSTKHQIKTAIMVDGGFYKKRAYYYNGFESPEDSAKALNDYCYSLLSSRYEDRFLYRIFYYDCLPISKKVYHPLLHTTVDLGKTDEYKWSTEFIKTLRSYRKFAVRLGNLSAETAQYTLKQSSLKKLMNGTISPEELTEDDFQFRIEQKGVDMRIGIDISSLALKKQVDQIILISGDSDFVPAAKHARREGIDFILAPMGATIKPDLFEHIDGMINRPKEKITKTYTEK